MCRLATVIQESVDDYTSKNDEAGPLPRKAPQNFSQDCSNRSMEARENVMKFLTWARELRVPESSIFSPDDLLKLKVLDLFQIWCHFNSLMDSKIVICFDLSSQRME